MPVSSGTCKSSGIYKIATSPLRIINEFSGCRFGGVQQRAFIWHFRFPSAILRAGGKAKTFCWVRKPVRPWLYQTNRLRRPWYVMPRQSFTLVLRANIDHWKKIQCCEGKNQWTTNATSIPSNVFDVVADTCWTASSIGMTWLTEIMIISWVLLQSNADGRRPFETTLLQIMLLSESSISFFESYYILKLLFHGVHHVHHGFFRIQYLSKPWTKTYEKVFCTQYILHSWLQTVLVALLRRCIV